MRPIHRHRAETVAGSSSCLPMRQNRQCEKGAFTWFFSNLLSLPARTVPMAILPISNHILLRSSASRPTPSPQRRPYPPRSQRPVPGREPNLATEGVKTTRHFHRAWLHRGSERLDWPARNRARRRPGRTMTHSKSAGSKRAASQGRASALTGWTHRSALLTKNRSTP